MVDENNYASCEKLKVELQSLDLPRLIDRMVSFARFKIYNHDLVEAENIASDVFEKFLTQERKWYDGSKLESALFGAVRSLSDNYNKKLKKNVEIGHSKIGIEERYDKGQRLVTDEIAYKELETMAINILKNHKPPPDYLEEIIFECWLMGMEKQQDVAGYLEIDILEVRKGVKRLKRKLGPIQEHFRKLGYGQE